MLQSFHWSQEDIFPTTILYALLGLGGGLFTTDTGHLETRAWAGGMGAP